MNRALLAEWRAALGRFLMEAVLGRWREEPSLVQRYRKVRAAR